MADSTEPHTSIADVAGVDGSPDVAGHRKADRLRSLLDRPISSDELERQTRDAALPLAREGGGTTGLVVFRIGSERLGIDVQVCRRVVPIAPVHRIPHRSNDVLAGLCAVDGELLLAARLDRLLGLEREARGVGRMLILSESRGSWALPVDEVEGVRRFESASFRGPPATVARSVDGLTKALIDLGEAEDRAGVVAVLDAPALLARLERTLA